WPAGILLRDADDEGLGAVRVDRGDEWPGRAGASHGVIRPALDGPQIPPWVARAQVPELLLGPVHHVPGLSAARPASSVSMALICARIGIRAGEPGRTSARLAASSRLARSRSPLASPRTS